MKRPLIIRRIGAKTVDAVLIVGLASTLPYPLGPLLGFIYSLVGDGLNFWIFKSQSLGKKILRLQTISTVASRRGKPVGYRASVLRNAPVGVATFFALIPVWGWLILGLIGIPLMVMEVYLMMTIEAGHRLGDVMGDTEVIDLRAA